MKKGIASVCVLLLSLTCEPVHSLSVTPTLPPQDGAGLMVTAYGVSSLQTSLDFVQLHNSSASIMSLNGWTLAVTTNKTTVPRSVHALEGLLTSKSHILYSKIGSIAGAGVYNLPELILQPDERITKLTLLAPDPSIVSPEQPVATTDGIYRRSTTTTGYSTSTTFTKLAEPITLYADQLYSPALVPSLQIVEVVAHHADCAPNDTSVVCGDYFKLRNTGDDVVDLSLYRARTDSSTTESSNAFSMTGVISPGEYYTVWLRDDGQKMSLTDSGGYVWLEDAAGIVAYYSETMVSYPSAGSTSKVGWAWALDTDGEWKWTSTPQPGLANVIYVPAEPVAVLTEATECPAGKYRNPETNRCRSIEEAVNVLSQCEEGKERSPITNRCRTVTTLAAAVLSPCEIGQERNPATNRCRAVAGATSVLTPCLTGYERNPETNRCRKTNAITPALQALSQGNQNTGFSIQTALLLTAGTSAVGYGMYEWRSEFMQLVRRLIKFFPSK